MSFFDRQLTPEELARSKYGRAHSTSVSPKAAKPRLREIIRKGPFVLAWANPNPPCRADGDDWDEDDGDAA